MLRNADGGGGCQLFRKKRYEGVRFDVISVTRGWVGVQFPGKERYVTLEWSLSNTNSIFVICQTVGCGSSVVRALFQVQTPDSCHSETLEQFCSLPFASVFRMIHYMYVAFLSRVYVRGTNVTEIGILRA